MADKPQLPTKIEDYFEIMPPLEMLEIQLDFFIDYVNNHEYHHDFKPATEFMVCMSSLLFSHVGYQIAQLQEEKDHD